MSTNANLKFVLERLKFPGTIVLNKEERYYSCGRGKENKIDCPSLAVSRKHCLFFCTSNELCVMDLQSSNGLFINGEQQKSHVMIKLCNNDLIGIGCRHVEDNDIELKEQDRFVYKLHIIVENGEKKSLPHSNENADVKSTELKSKHNPESGSTRKRIQKIAEHEVPKKVAKHQNDIGKKAVRHSRGKAQSSDEQNLNDIEIIHVVLNEDKLNQSGSTCGNSFVECASSIPINSIEKIPKGTKKSLLTNQHRKDDANLVKVKEEIPEDSLPKPTREERISLDEITSKQNNTFLLNNVAKKQIPESKPKNKTNQTPTTVIQEHPSKNSRVERASELNNVIEKMSKSKPEESTKSKCHETLNECSTSDSSRITHNFLIPESFGQYGSTLVKYEEELQITDTEEDVNLQLSKEGMVAPSPIKIKQIQQEPKTRFSEVDIVNLSDDEDDVFPCSQLFDTNFGTDVSFKQEIKEESIDIDSSRFERPDDNEDIILSLSDSEDEANPWLDKLSRSQSEEFASEAKQIKQEILDIDNEMTENTLHPNQATGARQSRLSFVAQKLPNENELYKPGIDRHENIVRNISDTNTVSSSFDISPEKINEKSVADDQLQKKPIQTEENTVSSSTCVPVNEEYESVSPSKSEKSIPVQTKLKLDKKIPEIEPLPLSTKKRRSLDGTKAKETVAKLVISKLSSKEKKEQKLKERKDEYLYRKEQKHRKQLNKWAECLPPSGKKKTLDLSKEEKRTLSDHRKAKLKEIAEKRLSLENKEEKKRSVPKPKAKVTLKNRGDLLLNDQLNLDSSKTSLNESAEKQSNITTNDTPDLTSTTKTSSNVTTVTKGKSKEVSKQVTSKPSMDFESYLKLCEVPTNIKIPKKSSIRKEDSQDISDKVKNLNIAAENSVKQSTTSKEEKSELKDKSVPKTNTTGKKRVHFAKELRTVREFEIDIGNSLRKCVGKDAPIPFEKLPAKVTHAKSCPKLEDFLFRIFSWKPVWLEEQRQFNTIAPAVPEHDLLPMLTYYKSYNDYYKIVSNLLLLEMWCSITKEFETVDMNMQRPTLMSSIVENSITRPTAHSTNSYLSSLLLEVLITKEGASKQAYPCYGDLVFFEYTRNNGRNHEFHKVFAYVTNVYQTIVTSHTYFNKELLKHVQNPHTLITYTVLTRPLENDICVNRVQRLRTVTYLRATMRLVQGLQYLPQSALMKSILSPEISLYQMPIVHNVQARPLVTKDKLNTKQLEAVFKVTDTVIQKVPKLCFIQGPPGTGKSTVIVNIITQILYGDNRYKNHNSSLRILVCAPSNAAIDEIVLRLLNIRASLKEKRFKMVRIGRPETMHPLAKDISVTELAKRDVRKTAASYASNQIPNDSVEEEKAFLLAKMNALKCEIASSYNVDDAYKKNIKMKLADMNAKYELLKNRKLVGEMNPREFAKLQRAAENRMLQGADIITCTLSSCYNAQMESIFGGSRERISVCIVDEATQSCEAETLIPLMLGVNTLVLVGDTNQLPATVISQRAKQLGLGQSIFARVQNAFDSLPHNPIMLLDTQYRMAHAVSYWPNKFFYAGKLKNGVQHSTVLPFQQYRILNLNACQNDNKFTNTDEAEFVANLVLSMLRHPNIESRKIELSLGIVTPYQVQRTLILEKLNERLSSLPEGTRKRAKIHVNTVDAFQGQERDVIIMSCVRSNGIGFLSDRQRLCVALTRAKHCLVLCGNFNTFMRDPMWNALLMDGRGRGVYFNVNARTHPKDMKTFILKS